MKNQVIKSFIAILLFTFAGLTLFATDYYVATTGNDTSGDGSLANPWATVSKAFTTVPKNAGHTIHIGAGTFTEAAMITAPSGTTIMGEGTDKTVIASKAETFFLINKAKNVTIQDFAIDGLGVTKERMLYIEESSDIKVSRVDLRNGEGTGFWASNVKNIFVDGGVYKESAGRGTTGGDKSVVEWNHISNGVFQNVTINDAKAEAWRGWSDMSGVIITKCVFKACPTSAWNNNQSGNISVEWWGVTNVTNCEISYCSLNGTMSLAAGPGAGNKSMRVHHNIITGNYGIEMHFDNIEADHNFIHDCGYPFANFGPPHEKIVNHSIHHNVCYNTGFSMFMHYSTGIINMKAYNNTVYRSNGGGGFNYFGGEITDDEFANNIFINTAKSPFQTYNIPTHHNLFQFTPAVGTESVVGDPLFVKKNSTDVSGFTIQAGSAAIDKGILIPGITDNATDGKPDIGAYEFGETWTVGPTSPDAKPYSAMVSISSPKIDQLFSLPAKITINAEAMSLDTVNRVDFYAGESKIGEDSSAPYSVVWNASEKGNYKLTAVLIDNKGNQTKSAPVAISISGITTKLTAPVTGAKFLAPTTVSLAATASVVGGSIKKVEFYANDLKLGEDSTEPYTFEWENVGAGNYKLKSVAWDELNFSRESAVVNISVSNSVEMLIAAQKPEIDGVLDGVYSTMNAVELVTAGSISSSSDLAASWTAVYNNDAIYVFADVTDDKLFGDNVSADFYKDDSVELFIDADNSKDNSYGANDFAYNMQWNSAIVREEKHNATAGVTFKLLKSTKGYTAEIQIPWSTLKGMPAGKLIGLEVQVNDDDDGGERDTELNWNTSTADAWQYPYLLGTVKLSDKTTAIGNIRIDQNVKVYPNPSTGIINIQTNLSTESSYSISSLTGSIVKEGKISGSIEKIDLSERKGIYFIRVENGKSSHVQKVIVY